MLGGCGGNGGGASTQRAGAATDAGATVGSTQAVETTTIPAAIETATSPRTPAFAVTVRKGTVSGDLAPTVPRGATVQLTVRSDVDDTVHVHGYDKEFEVGAGDSAAITFSADIPGRFEVEMHESGAKLMMLTVK